MPLQKQAESTRMGIGSLISFLARRSRGMILLIAFLLILAVGAIDYLTGYELSVGLFYTLPIILLSWYLSRPAAIQGAIVCALSWFVANSLTAPEALPQAVLLWNTGIRLGFFLVVAYPTSALREAYNREAAAARVDVLTGVSSSRAFHESGQLELLRAARVGYPLTLLYLDVDNFKAVNDTHGHQAGDEVLRRVGHSLRESLRVTDLVGRLGGDEFAILLVNVAEEQTAPVIAKIEASLAQSAPAAGVPIGFSIGTASANAGVYSLDELIATADQRMYQVKNAKRQANLQAK